MCLRLSARTVFAGGPNRDSPICLLAVDQFGDHQVGFGGNGDRTHRHDSVRDALFSAAQTAALAPRKKVPSLIPGTRSRPSDIFRRGVKQLPWM